MFQGETTPTKVTGFPVPISNPTPASWLAGNGYLPVVETPYPQDGKYCIGSWQEQDGKIVRVWIGLPDPELSK